MNTHSLVLLQIEILLHYLEDYKSSKINPSIVFFLLSVSSNLPMGVTLEKNHVSAAQFLQKRKGGGISVLCLKWEACESCSTSNSRDGSFTHRLKHPLTIHYSIRTSGEPIPNLKYYFYDYKTMNSLGLFQLILPTKSVSKSIASCSDEFVLTLTHPLFTLRLSAQFSET